MLTGGLHVDAVDPVCILALCASCIAIHCVVLLCNALFNALFNACHALSAGHHCCMTDMQHASLRRFVNIRRRVHITLEYAAFAAHHHLHAACCIVHDPAHTSHNQPRATHPPLQPRAVHPPLQAALVGRQSHPAAGSQPPSQPSGGSAVPAGLHTPGGGAPLCLGSGQAPVLHGCTHSGAWTLCTAPRPLELIFFVGFMLCLPVFVPHPLACNACNTHCMM